MNNLKLCCCGTSATETLGIRKCDVYLEQGIIIKLINTKNSKPRYIVPGDTMASLMRSYASKFFFRMHDNDYIPEYSSSACELSCHFPK